MAIRLLVQNGLGSFWFKWLFKRKSNTEVHRENTEIHKDFFKKNIMILQKNINTIQKKLSVSLCLLCVSLCYFFALNTAAAQGIQPKKMTKKFFPNFEEVQIKTPAFTKKKGFTKYAEMMDFLKKTIEPHSEICTLTFIGESQKGEKIPLLVFNKKSATPKVKVWFQGGLHGDEPAGTEGMLYLIQQLLENEMYATLLDRIELAIVPMANIDGYNKQKRFAANGLDLNRDWTKLVAPETAILTKAYHQFSPEVAVDFHEYRPFRRDYAHFGSFGVVNPNDVMFLYSGNLNVSKPIRHITETLFVKEAQSTFDNNKIQYNNYFRTRKQFGKTYFSMGGRSPRSTASKYPLTDAISLLMEVRGVGLKKTSFNRRVYTTFLAATSFLKTAYNNVEAVKKSIIAAQILEEEIVIKSRTEVSDTILSVIDIDKNERIDLKVTLHNAFKTKANLTRQRPVAYYILPTSKAVIEKLDILGFKMNTLKEQATVKINCYLITEYDELGEVFEGINEQVVTTQVKTKIITFPTGTVIVSTQQKNANLLTELLEPEAINGFVRFRVIETKKGDVLPVYRKME